ncbi:unnamed protein product [Fusarium equiseti]|uniref:Secretory lipase n=1 Tax=Fusarium equiseti TaxID=61235 RepID=A0A8J2NGM5_FUSEQ|nr:unnamed protein product [Fusarium equiseti]
MTAHASTQGRASNFPVSPEVAAQYKCGAACHDYLNTTTKMDLEDFDTPFDFEFYETAKNLSGSKPGEILKLKPIDPQVVDVPSGATIYKIQYTSVDMDNETIVPATGFIAFPYVHQDDTFKLVAFAHGTSGVFRGCAPSTSSTLYDYDTWIPLIYAGYAVVGTDYAGLGNNFTSHKYIANNANANDVYWSVIAAQKAFPCSLSKDWVSIGHSQGGGASWKLSESQAVQSKESGYLGGVAVAPNTHIYDAFLAGSELLKDLSDEELRDYGSASYVPSLYFALRAAFPSDELLFLSDLSKKRFQLGEYAQLCAAALPAVVHDLNQSQIITSSNPSDFSILKKFQNLNAPAQGARTSRPLLVIVGANDTTVDPAITAEAFRNSCKVGNALHLSIYPELEHSQVFGASAPQWLNFIKELFQGHGLRNCDKETMITFDAAYASKRQEG